MGKGVKYIHEKCDPELAKDSSLPTNAFLVTYKLDGQTLFDIVIAVKKVDVFDHYWDNYRADLLDIKLADGKMNPKLWSGKSKERKDE